MIPDKLAPTKKPLDIDRPFPLRCRKCGERQVVLTRIEYDAEVRHDGRLHSFRVADLQIPVCGACGERVFTEHVDEQINDSLRAHLRLLSPAEIHAAFDRVGLKYR